MNKAQLVERIAESNDIDSKAAAERILDLIVDSVKAEVVAGNKVDFGLGVFTKGVQAARSARPGRNPHTGEAMDIEAKPAKNKVKFKASASFDRAVNS